MYGIIAILKAKPGEEAALEAAFLALRAEVRKNEPGNVFYDLYKTPKEPGTYYIMEQYTDETAAEAHGKSAHFKAGAPKLGATLAGPPEIKRLSMVK